VYNYNKTNGREIPMASGCACGYQGWSNYETYAMHEWLLLEVHTQETHNMTYPEWLTKLAKSDMLPNAQVQVMREKFTNPVEVGSMILGLYKDFVLACLERVNWTEILQTVKEDKR
jgi:hypothetical protein